MNEGPGRSLRSPPPHPVRRPAMKPVRETPSKLLAKNPYWVLDCWPTARGNQLIPQRASQKAIPLVVAQSRVLNRTKARNGVRGMKTRIPLPRGKERKRGKPHPKINLGITFRDSRRLTKQVIDSTLWNFKRRLKYKSDNTYAMILQLSSLLVGTVFQSSYVYHATLPYVGWLPGYANVRIKPNIRATRLLIEQILHCRSNAPLRRICNVINTRG